MTMLELASSGELASVAMMRRSAEGRAVPLPGFHSLTDSLIVQLAAGFSRGEPGKLAVPYARLDS